MCICVPEEHPTSTASQLEPSLDKDRWRRTLSSGRPRGATDLNPLTDDDLSSFRKGKKCLLAERPEACLVRGRGCPQHNPQPARLHRGFDARRLLARRGVAREHRDEGGKLGNAVSVRRRACRNRSTVKAPRTLVAIAGFHPKPSSRFVRSRALFGLFLLDNASSRGADETRLVGS